MHVLFLAPHFPANQRRFVAGLKAVGAQVTGVGEARVEHLDGQLTSMLDGWEQVSNVCDPDALRRVVRRLAAQGRPVDRIEAAVEAHVLAAAAVRESEGVTGLPMAVVERCRDKLEMKRFLSERGVPCARQAGVSTGEDARAFAQAVGFPFVLKPRAAAGASGTERIDSAAHLERAIAARGLDRIRGQYSAEEFLSGHEGFYDTLTVDGEVVFEAVSHYYPGVLDAMRTRFPNPYLITTNRLDAPSYGELRRFGRQILGLLGITTSATHMEWFFGPEGLKFNEIAARPPGVNVWDLYAAVTGWDLYQEWARAVCWGDVWSRPGSRWCGGLLALRPDQDGVILGYDGVEAVQARYGDHILKAHLPPAGTPTQPVEAGYMANAWAFITAPDYDQCREIIETIGRTIRVRVRPA